VFIGTRVALGIRGFAIVDALSVVIWLMVAAAILRLRKREKAGPQEETRMAA